MKTLMIVDDTTEQREVLNFFLGKEFKIIEAISGREAAMLLESEKIDLIISDLQMPDGDGFWLLNFIRSRKHCSLPVIILSGNPSANPKEVEGAGANVFLFKPYNFGKLRNIICSLLGNSDIGVPSD